MKKLNKIKEIMIIIAGTLTVTLAVLVLIDIDHAELVVGAMGLITLLISAILECISFKLEKVEEMEEL